MPDEELLSIETTTSDSEIVMVLSGELDPHTSGELEAAIGALTDLPARVVIDMADLDFIDSAGLRVILAANQTIGAQGSRLILRSPSETARRILEITALLETLTVE